MKPTQSPHLIIAVAGFARTGKDTLANAILAECDAQETEMGVGIAKFANSLKQALQDAFDALGVDIDVFTEDPIVKAMLRPVLVEFGRFARSMDKDVFVKDVVNCIEETVAEEDEPSAIIISDMRYANEYDVLKAACAKHGWVFVPIYIGRNGTGPANAEEASSFNELMDEKAGRFAKGNAHYLVFDEGDTQGIQAYARKFVSGMHTYLRT